MILTRLRAGLLAALVVSFASLPAFAQLTPLFQSGVMTRARDLPMMTRDGQIQDAAAQGVLGDANGRGVNPFAVTDSNALGICTHTAPTGSSHHSLCLGHDANGAAIITIDGSSYSLPSGGGGGIGTVTSVGIGGPGGIFSTSGGPVTGAGTLSFGVAGTAGAIPYFSSTSHLSTSGLLTANMPVIGGGPSAAPTVGTVTGTGTQFVVSNAPTLVAPALGTIASGNLSAGTVTATGGTTNSALAGRFGNMLDLVKDFGADPTGVSDTCALLATIATARPIHVPTGKYLCSTSQTITQNLNLWGDGAAEYNQGAAVPSATGIQGTWLYRTTNVGLTISVPSPPSGYVSGGIRNLALAETQPAVNITAGPTSDGKGFTGTSGAAVLSVSNTTGLTAGMGVTDTTNTAYIPPGSTILSVIANTSITISNNLTHNLAGTDVLNFWKPTVYDPFIQLVNAQGEFDIDGVYCYGVYRCISDGGAAGGGRLNVQHVRGQSFLHMIELENQFDSVVWRDVRDWCYWSCNAAVYNWMLTNGEAFTVAGVDGLAASDIFAIGKKACLRFKVSAVNPGHVTQGGQFSNFYCDFSKYGVWNTGVVTQFQMVNAIINGGGYAVGTTAQSTAIQDDGDGANGSGVVAYISSLRCDAMSVACVNGANATSGGSIQVDNLLVQNFIGTDYVKAVTSTGPYYLNIGQVQLSNSSGNYFAINNAILSGFTLNNGATSSSQALQVHHRYDSTGNETELLVDNKSSDTGAGTCAAVWADTNASQSYAVMRTCNNGAASLIFGSGVTSPAITHAGGTLALGTITGSVTATGGSTATTLANLAARAISVKDFGALCDGSTNDATAINAAFVANPTGVISMPGNCRWTSTITLPTSAFKLIGGGLGAPWLCRVGNDSTCMKFSSGGSTAGSAIYDFSIDATGTDGGSHTGINFDATKAPQNFTMHNWQLVNSCNGMLVSQNNNFTAENGIVQTLGDSCAYGIKWDTDPAVGTGVFLNLNNVLIACSSNAATATRGFVWDGDSTTLVANALTILSCKDLFVAENSRSHATKFPVYAQITNSAFEGAYTGVACKFSAARHISIFGTYCFNNKPNTDTDSLQLSYDAASSGGASQFFQMTDSFVMQAHNRCAFIDWTNVQITSTVFVGCAVTAGSPGIKIGANAVAVSLGSGNQIAATAATYAVETTASCAIVTIAADVYMNSLAGAGRSAVNDLGSCVQGLAPAFGTVQVSPPSGATTLTTKGYNYFTINEALAAPQLTFAPAVAGGLLQFLLKNTSTGAGVFASVTVATGTANSSMQMGVDDAGGLGSYLISGSGRTEGLYINTAAGPINLAPTGALKIGGTDGVTCAAGSPTGSFEVKKGIVIHC